MLNICKITLGQRNIYTDWLYLYKFNVICTVKVILLDYARFYKRQSNAKSGCFAATIKLLHAVEGLLLIGQSYRIDSSSLSGTPMLNQQNVHFS